MARTTDRSTPPGCDPASVREWREKQFDPTLRDEIDAYLALSDGDLHEAGLTRAFLLDELAKIGPRMPAPLRSVRVTYANGNQVSTNMAAGLSDEAIRDYFRVGRTFNVGNGPEDDLQSVASVEILR